MRRSPTAYRTRARAKSDPARQRFRSVPRTPPSHFPRHSSLFPGLADLQLKGKTPPELSKPPRNLRLCPTSSRPGRPNH